MPLISVIAVFATSLPVLAGLYRLRGLRGSFSLLFACFCADALVEGWGFALAVQSKNNLWMYNVSIPIVGALWMTLYGWWSRSRGIRIAFATLTCGLFALSFARWGNHEFVALLDDITFTYFSLMLAFGSATVLYVLSSVTDVPLFHNPKFWVAGAALVYYMVTAVLYSMSKFILGTTLDPLYDVQATLSILANGFYSYALLCSLPQRT